MIDLLNSLKSDLLSRRLLPFLGLLGIALAGAIAYAVLGGGSSNSSSPVPAVAVSAPTPTEATPLPVHQAPENPNAAVAETTDGARFQHHSGSHNPFSPLASAKAENTPAKGVASASTTTPTSSSSGKASETSSGSGGGTELTTTEPVKPTPKVKRVHTQIALVSLLFGLAPTAPGQLSQLTPYANVKRLEPLPSASQPLIVFQGVSSDRKNAIFTLTREAILSGSGTCLPSPTQCEAVSLGLGQTEEFSYLEANGQSVAYELELESIAWRETSVYAKTSRVGHVDKAGQALLRRLHPAILGELHFSSAKGVLFHITHHGA